MLFRDDTFVFMIVSLNLLLKCQQIVWFNMSNFNINILNYYKKKKKIYNNVSLNLIGSLVVFVVG